VGGSRTKLGVSTENQLIRRQGENTRGQLQRKYGGNGMEGRRLKGGVDTWLYTADGVL